MRNYKYEKLQNELKQDKIAKFKRAQTDYEKDNVYKWKTK